ncbi:MAG TPA: BadF/BadG/BcrA/BcrD ATPase family protein [Candidatus Limnocylindrales bacterium]|nr:BadF/BadG/BcrA/BcrD ATPase family protein [Candidatus Limnocylindrales bacterium]
MTAAGAGARAAVLAVDGGNSKADLALVAADGTLLAAVHGPSISHQAVGLETGMANLEALARRAADAAGLARDLRPIAERAVHCLAGADYPEDVRLLQRAIRALGLSTTLEIRNDTFGALRAGTHRPWGVVLICGRGVNGAGVAPNGKTIRFDGVGTYSGDWGGGGGIGLAAIAAAVRGRDGRGPRTRLERDVPAFFGVASPPAMTKALYLEQIPRGRITELAPLVFQAAADGDGVARGILDRLADELVAMATALIHRLRLAHLDPEVVLAGGVFRNQDQAFHDRLEAGIHAVAPRAELRRLAAPPVLGAALIGLDAATDGGSTPPGAEARLRRALETWAGAA